MNCAWRWGGFICRPPRALGTQHLGFLTRGKSGTAVDVSCQPETNPWHATPRHTLGSPSGPRSASQLSSGMRATFFSGRSPHPFFLLALTLPAARGPWWGAISTGSGLAMESTRRSIMYAPSSRRSAAAGSLLTPFVILQIYGVKALEERDGFPSAQGPYLSDRPTLNNGNRFLSGPQPRGVRHQCALLVFYLCP